MFCTPNGINTHTTLHPKIFLYRYETHPNQYLPHYQIGSETETEDERSKLLNTLDDPYSISFQPAPISQLPQDRNGVTYSPYRVRSNRSHNTASKRFSEFGGDMSVISGMEDEEEGASLWGGAASNTSASDLDNVCDIEDSEVNSEFENDDKAKR